MRKTTILRGIAIAIWVLGAIAIGFGFVPGVEVYRDANDCFGHALASLFSHGSARDCVASWQLVETRANADPAWGTTLYFLLLMAPGLLVWRYPKLKVLLAWTLVAIVATFLLIAATFDLGSFTERTVLLWPAYVFAAAVVAMLSALIVGLPVFCAIYAFVTRPRPAPKPELARARIHKQR